MTPLPTDDELRDAVHHITHGITAAYLEHGACGDQPVDLFFPGRGNNAAVDQAKAICATCPHRRQCLAHAIVNGEKYGIWGGTSEKERRAMRQALRNWLGLPAFGGALGFAVKERYAS